MLTNKVLAACDKPLAVVSSAQGKVHVQVSGRNVWQAIQKDQALCPGDYLRTARWSRATLALSSGAVFTVDQNTTLSFAAPQEQAGPWYLELLKGTAFFRSRQPQRLDVHTPFVNAVHEGTEFLVAVDSSRSEITVFDGQVAAENNAGKAKIAKGQKGTATAHAAPRVQAVTIKPEEAVQWALYYPPVIDLGSGPDHVQAQYQGQTQAGKQPLTVRPELVEGPVLGEGERSVEGLNQSRTPDNSLASATNAYWQGDIARALAELDKTPQSQQTPQYLTLKAGLLLTVGRVDEAQPLISQVQQQQPNNPDALGLQAIINVTKNRQQQALELANKAVNTNPGSATALIAQSYAQQSLFKLEDAIQSTQKATQLNPNNALAWARLSELELSQGDHKQALKSAQKAQQLNPKLSRTQTVLGFADLAETETDQAKQQFQQALTLDSADPLARLGLGLAKIRQGDVDAGKDELETAANLDPGNAIIRSYLGKAYYELRNKDHASTEYGIAKGLDPNDPTPYFYDAILKQTTNRPVEALHDMQKAIELNDNRGVYRSRLLLDEDLAARSAAQGRIYNDLGFQRPGLVEGWKSVNSDPSNYSAHRLLADNYASQPRHDISRVSELLQSQLLQPINMTPIQPQLSERNLLSIDGAGPAASSFNEFNPLFTKDRFALQASGIVGSNDTYGDEVVQSGLWRNFSYSIGQYHYETSGFRENNDVQVDLLNGFIQSSLTPDFSIQAEIRHREFERGDIDLLADGSFFKVNELRLGTNTNTYRGGIHYSINQNSDLITSYIHTDGRNYSNSLGFVNIFGDQGELQHLYRSENFNVVSGIGFSQSGTFDRAEDPNKQNDTSSASHANGYIYTYTHYPKNIDWILGVSVDSLEESSFNSKKQINPKAGMVWRLNNDATLRTALSRTLKRPLITNQTIEPTQVAGFNQFYDDYTFTDALLYGFAIDKKWGSWLFGGLEFVARDLDLLPKNQEWNEHSYKAYLNWNLTPKLTATFAFHLEDFNGAINDSIVPESTTTYDSKAGFRFFDPSGFFCNFEAEYVNQKTVWPDVFSAPAIHNDFVLLNAGIGMRLPKRMGILNFDVKNILDEQFNYQSIGGRSPGFAVGDGGQAPPFIPGRTFFARLTLAF